MIDWADFHFLRPEWLLALALWIPLCWAGIRGRRSAGAWRGVCDAHLLKHLITNGGGGTRLWPLALMALGWTAACLAMAGPAWERLPRPAFRSPEQRVLVLSLAPSMNATDVEPSRLARARYKLQDALGLMEGAQVGLVIFNEEPYVVTPITDDPRVVAEFLPILETDLMPGNGVRLDRAIDEARALLEQAGAVRGGIVLVTDRAGDDPSAAVRAARNAAAAGYEVSVLAIGTEGGAPIPTPRGFLRDGAGKVLMARLEADTLTAVASAGGGSYALMSADDRDIDTVLNLATTPADAGTDFEAAGINADVWNDMGILLVWLAALLSPLAFRRGWATSLSLCFLVGATTLPSSPADAAVEDWLWRSDQRGAEAFQAGRHDEAAALFEDADWRASALYRNGAYEEAAELLSESSAPSAQYNLGNALARSGRLEDAVAAYDRALEEHADHADAQHNRDLIAKLLEEQQQEQQSGGSDEGSESASPDGDSSQSDPSDSPGSGASHGQQGAEPDSSNEYGSDESGASSSPQEPDASGEGETQNARPDASSQQGEEQVQSSDAQQSGGQAPQAHSQAGAEPNDQEAASPQRESTGAQEAASGAEEPRGDDASRQVSGSPTAPMASEPDAESAEAAGPARSSMAKQPLSERDQAIESWLNRISVDPGGLLREKLRRRYAQKRYLNPMGGRTR